MYKAITFQVSNSIQLIVSSIQQSSHSLSHIILSLVKTSSMYVCSGPCTMNKVCNSTRAFSSLGILPSSNTPGCPHRVSRERAATTFACLLINSARCRASSPRPVINWVPLINARPYIARYTNKKFMGNVSL